jgi:hypothetical protein
VSDYGFREYQILHARLNAATNGTDLIGAADRITRFVQQPDTNPVYAETVVNLLMSRAIDVIRGLEFSDNTTHDIMTTRLVTRHVGTTVTVWQRTMEHNASGPEG